MYDRITPLFRNVTDDVLKPSTDGTGYYKSAALLRRETTRRSSPPRPSAAPRRPPAPVSATIKRDPYGVPHIYSDTDAGAIFGAGYAVATDQSLLLNQARYNGVAGLIDLPGVPAINLILGLYDYKPTAKVVKRGDGAADQGHPGAGRAGQAAAQRHRHLPRGHQRAHGRRRARTRRSSRGTDIYALNAVKAQFLGEGGGSEVDNALFLDGLRSQARREGRRRAPSRTCRRATTRRRPSRRRSPFRAQTKVSVSKPQGMVRLKNGIVQVDASIKLPGAAAASAAPLDGSAQLASQHPDRVGQPRRRPARRCSSAARRSATTTPA